MSKWGLGGLLVALLVIVIWFPLLFMSYINSVYTSNLPQDATFTLSIGGYQVGSGFVSALGSVMQYEPYQLKMIDCSHFIISTYCFCPSLPPPIL